jgi:gelsolin
MLKDEVLDISQTNMALFGSPLEKEIKSHAAHTEQMWHGVGHEDGLQIWRIEKFKIANWPKEKYGQFHEGDSYILLRTKKIEDAYHWDVHFWLGKHTSQDEAGTAAYKTVELDDFLDGYPIQHREVDGYESDLFLSYFPKGIRILPGGIESGFKHVSEEAHRTRLLQIKGGRKNVTSREVPLEASSLNSGDAFILDAWNEIWLFLGSGAGIAEKTKGNQLCRALDDERGSNLQVHVFTESEMHQTDDSTNRFWAQLGGRVPHIRSAADGGSDAGVTSRKSLHKLSDSSGNLTLEQVTFSRASLNGSDVFIIDVGSEVFVWIGKASSDKEKQYAMHYGQQYLKQHNLPSWLPLSRVLEGGENEVILAYFA